MAFGVSSACFFGRCYTEQGIEKLGQMGVPNAEAFLSSDSEYAPQFIQKLKAIAKNNGVRILSIHALSMQFEPQLFSFHARQREDAERVFLNLLDGANVLKARTYVMHGYANIISGRKMKINFSHIADRLNWLSNKAKERGICLTLENVHWCCFNHPNFATKIIEAGAEDIHFTLDLKQVAQSGYPLEQYLEAMKGRVKNIHICDFEHNQDGVVPRAPFEGEFDFGNFLKKLNEINFDGDYILELYSNNFEDEADLGLKFRRMRDFFMV